MAGRFKIIPLDYVSLVLTVLALIFHNIGFFVGAWWKHEGSVGTSRFGMLSLRLCQFTCVDRDVLVVEGGREWILIVRIFEVFGEIFLLIAMLMVILALLLRRRPIHTAVIYLHGAAALFILVGVFIFLGCSSSLNKNLKGDGSVQYPFGLCILAGLICVAASVVSGYGLKTHLLLWDDEDEALDDGTMEAE